jgi:hypothetical protein
MSDELVHDVFEEVFDDEIISEEKEDMGDALGPFDDSYFDEPFGVYEEPFVEYVFEYVPSKVRYFVPLPNKQIPEPIFGNFVSLTRGGEGTVSC